MTDEPKTHGELVAAVCAMNATYMGLFPTTTFASITAWTLGPATRPGSRLNGPCATLRRRRVEVGSNIHARDGGLLRPPPRMESLRHRFLGARSLYRLS